MGPRHVPFPPLLRTGPLINALDKIKDNKYIYGLLMDVIKEVGKPNVVQIVTNNGSTFLR